MNDQLKTELLHVAAQSADGILRPQAVVEFANANPESELHKRFEWDDAEAARSKLEMTPGHAVETVEGGLGLSRGELAVCGTRITLHSILEYLTSGKSPQVACLLPLVYNLSRITRKNGA